MATASHDPAPPQSAENLPVNDRVHAGHGWGYPPESSAVHQRLTSIEHSIAEIRGLLERMVRVEERVLAANQHMARIDGRLDEFDQRLGNAEKSGARAGWVVGGVERLFWLAVTAAVGWLGTRS